MVARRFVLIALSAIVLFPPASSAAPAVSWSQRMQQLSEVMRKLLPDLAATKPNHRDLQVNAKRLAALAHAIETPGKQTPPPGDYDPSLELFAGMLAEDTKEAAAAIKAGNVEYGRKLLRSATASCIGCHTRHDKGARFTAVPDTAMKKLDKVEQAELHVAMREFDRGLELFQEVVADKNYAEKAPFAWELAVRRALLVAVSVKRDPAAAERVVDAVLATPSLPGFLRTYAQGWKKSIAAWRADKKPSSESPEQLWKEAERLLTEARNTQRYRVDRSADVAYLRMSSLLHDYLRQRPTGERAAEALYLLGHALEATSDPQFWTLPQSYFEQCIRKAPHSETAMRCYDRFEEAVHIGYSGSGGLRIPADVQRRLTTLRKLAEPERKEKPVGEPPRG
jgi:mono/diheme cytochrome c family protein